MENAKKKTITAIYDMETSCESEVDNLTENKVKIFRHFKIYSSPFMIDDWKAKLNTCLLKENHLKVQQREYIMYISCVYHKSYNKH